MLTFTSSEKELKIRNYWTLEQKGMRTSIYLVLLTAMKAWESNAVRIEAQQLNLLGGGGGNLLGNIPGLGDTIAGATQGLGSTIESIGNNDAGGIVAGGLNTIGTLVPNTAGDII